MIKKKEEQVEPVDLIGMTDDEIHYIGECFTKELNKVLDTYNPYFMKYDFYKKLYSILYTVLARLEEEKREVE
jgi:hypothetical protein